MTSPVEESFTGTNKAEHRLRRLNLKAIFFACLGTSLVPCVLGYDIGVGPLFMVGLAFMANSYGKHTSKRAYLRAIRSVACVSTVALVLSYFTTLNNHPASTWIQATIGLALIVFLWMHWFKLSKLDRVGHGVFR